MDNHISPFDNECVWYYLIVVSVGIIIAWAFILMGCFGDACKWPSNLRVWGFTTPFGNILIYLAWTVAMLMLMWAFFHSTCDDQATTEMRNIHRGIFLIIVVLAIVDFILFFLIHNVVSALVANVFSLAIVIGSIIMFSTIRDDTSWYCFPMLLWLCYRIYALMSILALNPYHPDMHNYGIAL